MVSKDVKRRHPYTTIVFIYVLYITIRDPSLVHTHDYVG